MGTGVLSQE